MAKLIFLPIADEIESGTYLLYDGACGTGGMLTVAEETLQQLAEAHGKQVASHLYGQEINAETYAICKADLLLKGEGEPPRVSVVVPAFNEAERLTKFSLAYSRAIIQRCGFLALSRADRWHRAMVPLAQRKGGCHESKDRSRADLRADRLASSCD